MGRASTRLHSGLPGKGRPEIGSSGGAALDLALPNRRLPGARDPLAEARDRFLSAEPVDRKVVREPILASWWRSRDWRIAADRLDLSYLGAPDLDTMLARSAEPVLRHLHEQLDGQPISIILTDATGLVLRRLTGDRDLERQLDTIMSSPASPTRKTSSAPTASGPPWNLAARRTCSGTSTTRSGLRAWPAPGSAPRPALRQDRRRDRPDLLAQGRRPAHALPGQVHR